MTGPDASWEQANGDTRPEVHIWLDPTDSGTSILVTTDHNGHREIGAFWQPDDHDGDNR